MLDRQYLSVVGFVVLLYRRPAVANTLISSLLKVANYHEGVGDDGNVAF